jgi:hypothetical protein
MRATDCGSFSRRPLIEGAPLLDFADSLAYISGGFIVLIGQLLEDRADLLVSAFLLSPLHEIFLAGRVV